MKLQVTVEGKSYEVEVEILEEDERAQQSTGIYQPVLPAIPPMRYMGAKTQASDTGSDSDEEKICRSPVTGLATRVYVVPGKQILAGDLIMVLEAMKMETNVTAHQAGIVKTLHVVPGDSVKVNQVLVEFE